MATDIKFNSEAGTFYTTLQPPAFSGTNSGLLHQTWGSRIAEVSGRVRGLAGSCWLKVGDIGTVGTIGFPTGFFSFVPIVEVSVLLPKLVLDKSDQVYTPFKNEWCIDFDYWGGKGRKLPQGDYIVPIDQVPVYMNLIRVSAAGFYINCDPTLYGAASYHRYEALTNDQLLIYWHAFGC